MFTPIFASSVENVQVMFVNFIVLEIRNNAAMHFFYIYP